MLAIEVISCPDPEYQGLWRFHKNQVYLGFPEGDIRPELNGLCSFAFMLEVLPDMVQAIPHPELPFWLLNGKRATKSRKLRLGDEINVSGVKMVLREAKHVSVEGKKAILDRRLQELVASQSPLLPLIKILSDRAKP